MVGKEKPQNYPALVNFAGNSINTVHVQSVHTPTDAPALRKELLRHSSVVTQNEGAHLENPTATNREPIQRRSVDVAIHHDMSYWLKQGQKIEETAINVKSTRFRRRIKTKRWATVNTLQPWTEPNPQSYLRDPYGNA